MKRRFLFFVCGLAAVLAVLSVLWQPCLFLRGEQGADAVIPMWKDHPVSISFIHSVQKTPVQENLVARADGSGFELISTKYQSFGVGLPFLESEGEFREEGDYYIFDRMQRRFPRLSLRTGMGTRLTVQVAGREYPLYEVYPPGRKIDLFVAPFIKGYFGEEGSVL